MDLARSSPNRQVLEEDEYLLHVHFNVYIVCSEYIWRLVFRDFENDGKLLVISYFGNLLGNFGGISCKKNFEDISIDAKVIFSAH